MVNMTLSIPERLHKKMKNFSEIRWSEIARKAIEQKVRDLEEIEKITSKSRLTKKDVDILTKKIKKDASKRFHEADSRY